jgi:hypothetical protein
MTMGDLASVLLDVPGHFLVPLGGGSAHHHELEDAGNEGRGTEQPKIALHMGAAEPLVRHLLQRDRQLCFVASHDLSQLRCGKRLRRHGIVDLRLV